MSHELTEVPASFAAGTTLRYRRSLSEFPAGDGWTLTFSVAGVGEEDVTATADGNVFVVEMTATQTAALGAGLYQWSERVSKAADVFEVGRGVVTILPNVATAAAGDLQPWAEELKPLVEDAIKGRFPAALNQYQVAGRAVSKMTLAELRALLAELEAIIAAKATPSAFGRKVLFSIPTTGFDT